MRKLVAMLCATALMLAMAVPALANPSIDILIEELVIVETEVIMEEEWVIVVEDADPSSYANADVRDVVSQVNDPKNSITVADVVEKLSAYLPAGTEIDLKPYDFVTRFADIVLEKENAKEYYFDGNPVPVKVTLRIDALKGETDLSNYLILLIDPETGAAYFIELDPAEFNAETGEITIEIPCLGAIALIQK